MFFAFQANKLSVLNVLNYNYHQTHFFNETINTKFRLIIRILLHHFDIANLFLYAQHKINVARNILIASKKWLIVISDMITHEIWWWNSDAVKMNFNDSFVIDTSLSAS